MPFAGVQLGEGETPHQLVLKFMEAAVKLDLPFRQLELLGTFSLGPTEFVRFRTDLPTKALQTVAATFTEKGRGVVTSHQGVYLTALPSRSQRWTVPATTMQAVAGMSRRMYRGPAINFWRRQFLDLDE